MPKKTQSAVRKNKSSLRYLVAHKRSKDTRLTGDFAIVETVDQAKRVERDHPEKAKQREADVPKPKQSFGAIQHELSAAIARHRTLDRLMALLDVISIDMQFSSIVKPVLDKHASQIANDKDRDIYSFNEAFARDVFLSLREAMLGVEGINQLPRLLLIGLVSEYDVFFKKLISVGLSTQTGIVSRIERSLNLKELAEFSTIEEASEYLIEKEIDAILYKDHNEQLISISKLFNANVDTKEECVKKFLEICERRNLFTHNGGRVNARYLKKCEEYGIKTTCKVGDELTVKSAYFREAMAVTQELSIKLTQFLWRKLLPSEREAADEQLNQTAYALLRGDDYQLAERILSYGVHHTDASSDVLRRMMIVNYANAIKLGGDQKRANAELEKVDWSATSIEFEISVAAVRSDLKRVLELLPEAAKSGKVTEESLRTWPVFKVMRGEKAFQDCFRTTFKTDLVSVSVAPADLSDGNPSDPRGFELANLQNSKTKH